LLLLGAILKFHCPTDRIIATLTLTAINRLALLTSHMTPYSTPHPHPFHSFRFLNIKVRLNLKEHRLKVSENRVLRRIFGPKRDEIISS
jgi:hypothetical protein